MAPRRILMNFRTSFLIIGSFLLFSWSCSTPQPLTTPSDNTISTDIETAPNLSSSDNTLNQDGLLISSLGDLYASQENEIPAVFERIKTYKEQEFDVSKGYRIQIYSGESVAEADTIASKFRGWINNSIEGYQAETYTFFKSPHYRVHVGDFHNREQALSYSRLVKGQFKDAWVVYDTVDPFMVPADTVSFSIR